MRRAVTNEDAMTLALGALGWVLSEPDRAQRLLSLTGLEPATLRAQAGDAGMLAAILGFVEGHEPDLVACAETLCTNPAALVAARQRLENS